MQEPNHNHLHKHTCKQIAGSVLMIFLLICIFIVPTYYFVGWVANGFNWQQNVLLWICISFLWVAFLSSVMFLSSRIHGGSRNPQKRKKRNQKQTIRGRRRQEWNILDDTMEAIDRLTSGDFSVLIENADERYYHGQLAMKINELASELHSMEQMRQEFVANVSHEIQSPLTAVSGFAALLKKEDLTRAERLHYLDIIESESRRLSKLSDHLMRLTQLESETAELQPQAINLTQQVQTALLFLETQWAAKELDVGFSGSDYQIEADQDLLEQVWINLIHNAIKFTPEGGSISISLSEHDGGVQCIVQDSGIGMPQEAIPHIFERFYKVDKARSRAQGGNGLGLSLVRRIVDLHGGRIGVESKPGEGSAFTVWLPKQKQG